MKVAVVGATGLVGTMMLKVLAERNFPVTNLIPVASDKSAGKEIEFKGEKYVVKNCADGVAAKASLALFSAGGAMSLEWAPRFAEAGTTVIDNSSAWRMHADKKLIVPEVNADTLTASDKIFPNNKRCLDFAGHDNVMFEIALRGGWFCGIAAKPTPSQRIISEKLSERSRGIYLI